MSCLWLLGCSEQNPEQPAEFVSTQLDFTQYVDPFIGTDGTGHTFPGTAYAFGMIVSPDTYNHDWDHTSECQYRDEYIMGFPQNHLSGMGLSDLGDLLLHPNSTVKPTPDTILITTTWRPAGSSVCLPVAHLPPRTQKLVPWDLVGISWPEYALPCGLARKSKNHGRPREYYSINTGKLRLGVSIRFLWGQ